MPPFATRVCACVLVALSVCAAAAHAQPTEPRVNILFYGNSFTYFSGGVDQMVRALAVADGRNVHVHSAAYGGATFEFHAISNYGAIWHAAPEGQHWDWVVLQGYSTELTHIGAPLNARLNGLRLFNSVRQHSPDARACLYETWARAPGFAFYTGTNPVFPGGPAQMQSELREGYAMLAADIAFYNTPDCVRIARAGDAWELANWDGLYSSDLYHQNLRGSLLSAMVIYTSIFQRPVSPINPVSVMSEFGIDPVSMALLADLADTISAQPPLATPANWTPLNENPAPRVPDPPPPPPPPPYCIEVDFNLDGNNDPDDLGDFINFFFAPDHGLEADFNRDGNIDPDDLGDFLNAYFNCR